jgi:signal transduction histidine kinase
MLFALVWWTILLLRYNDELLDISLVHSMVPNQAEILQRFEKNKYQIYGEGLVFGLSLIIGMYLIQRAYNKEVASNRKQNNFLLSITHELKSPLASIRLITDTIKKLTLNYEEKGELCDQIIKENTRLQNLVDNLLLASRLNHQYQYFFEPKDLPEIINIVIHSLKVQYPQANIEFKSDPLESEVWVDQESFKSLVHNLLENAIKYSPNNPNLNLQISKSDQANYQVKVTDFGLGIPDKEKHKIFDQFYRSGDEETRTTQGTGLGLYIVSRIVKAYDGRIIVSDNIPSGTVFKIILPFQPKNHAHITR